MTALLLVTACDEEAGGPSTTVDLGGEDDLSMVVDTGVTVFDAGDDVSVDPGEPLVFTRRALLEQIAETVSSTLSDFAASSGELEAAAAAWAADPTSDEARQMARDAWSGTMSIWQRAEVYQFGPAAPCCDVAGAADLRDEIYSWPLSNECRVDQETVEGNFANREAFASEPANVRGLDALEYLLFHETFENDCSPNSTINREGVWAGFSEARLREARAQYAATVAADLRGHADALHNAWRADRGDFAGEVARAGERETYASMQVAFNAITDALFYIEKEAKDMKLAIPAGISIDCDGDACPDDVESPWARRSLAHVGDNLRGFQHIFLGAAPGVPALGFDDYLTALGSPELSRQLVELLAAAIAAVDALGPDMRAVIESDLEGLRDAHTALRTFTDLFKTEFLSVLDLEPPQRAEGDND